MKKYIAALLIVFTSNLYGGTINQTNNYTFLGPVIFSNSVSGNISGNASTATYATNAGDSLTVGGLTAEDLMRVGSQFYFTTNLVSYGAVTGRMTTLVPPTTTQIATYSGPTNGQYLGTYLIPSNSMPSILLRGVYSLKFMGYHNGNNKHPLVGGDIYILNASDGQVVQEFENEIGTEVPYSAADIPYEFIIQINVTNDVPKDGYAFVMKTKMIDNDGYTGSFYSYFGIGYWAAFTMPIASGVYLTKAEAGTAAYSNASCFASSSQTITINGTTGQLNSNLVFSTTSDGSTLISSWTAGTNTLRIVSPNGQYTNTLMTTFN